MKINNSCFKYYEKTFYLYLIILFLLGISFWQFVKSKELNSTLEITKNKLLANTNEVQLLKRNYKALQKTFNINFKRNDEPLAPGVLSNVPYFNNLIVLHLKPHACTPCNMAIIEKLLYRLASIENFYILSHSSNQYFISLLELKSYDKDKIVWIDKKLYKYSNGGYDAELLYLNESNFIVGRIPIELLKDEMLFTAIVSQTIQYEQQ